MKYITTLLLCTLALMIGTTACKQKETIDPLEINYLPVRLPGQSTWSIMDLNTGQLITKNSIKGLPSTIVGKNYYVMDQDGAMRYYNVDNPTKPINSDIYYSGTLFSTDGFAVVSTKGSALKVIDAQGKTVKELDKDIVQASMFMQGMSSVRNDKDKAGFINTKGDIAIKLQYDQVFPFVYDDVALAIKDMSDSVFDITAIDRTGKELYSVASSEYRPVTAFYRDGKVLMQKPDTAVYLDRNGKVLNEQPSDSLSTGMQKMVRDGRYIGILDHTEEDTYIVVDKNHKMGLTTSDAKELIPCRYPILSRVTKDRYIAALSDTAFILLDGQGKQVGKTQFAGLISPSQGTIAKRGFIDLDMAVGAYLSCFDDRHVLNAEPGTNLTDFTTMLGENAAEYIGSNTLTMPYGPLQIIYYFDRPIASIGTDPAVAQFNFKAAVKAVAIVLDLHHTTNGTERTVADAISSNLGNSGFVRADRGLSTSQYGTTVAIGYDQGILTLMYYMDTKDAQPLPQNERK